MENLGMRIPSKLFWENKKVFITGHTGFKGSWLSLLLLYLGAEVTGYALSPNTSPNLYELCDLESKTNSVIGDIRDVSKLKASLESAKPDIVLHLAAQPLVRKSYEDPLYTIETNVMGTVNLLEAVRYVKSISSVVIVTTDKCYENKKSQKIYDEEDSLGGFDPYSGSKACAEILTATYRNSFFNLKDFNKHRVGIATARAGNVIGGGDWADDRLIPDIIRSIEKEEDILIRYPEAVRPWQHVLEPLTGYLVLAEKLFKDGIHYSEAWNFGPDNSDSKSVKWITNRFLQKIDGNNSKLIIDKNNNPHESNYLELDSTKALKRLEWEPRWGIDTAIDNIVDFVVELENGTEAASIMNKQISDYLSNNTSQ